MYDWKARPVPRVYLCGENEFEIRELISQPYTARYRSPLISGISRVNREDETESVSSSLFDRAIQDAAFSCMVMRALYRDSS
jgi:hypothetical protein